MQIQKVLAQNPITQKLSNRARTLVFAQPSDAFSMRAPKDVILSVLGRNKSLEKNIDFGRFEGIAAFFRKDVKHFQAVDLVRSRPPFHTYLSNYVSAYFDEAKRLKNFFVFDIKKKDVKMYNRTGKIIREYNPAETYALFYYKHDSSEIHKFLRENKDPNCASRIAKCIKSLNGIFENPKKLFTTESDIVCYRALDDVSLNEILKMKKDGMIFKDPSFVSVATKKRKTFQFLNLKNFNHIMEIKIPKGTKYISMDEFHDIVYPNIPETEMLLNKGSKFLIKSRDGVIKAEYLGS